VLQDKRALERLAEIESAEGRKERYHIEALMLRAKRVMRTESAAPHDLAKITEAISDYEAMVKATEEFAVANKGSKIGSSFISASKEFLTTAKQLMRTGQVTLQQRRPDDAQFRRRMDGPRLAGAPHARLQSARQ
jgi:hypothetical protein